jgi:peptidoglycan/xylan/chitin deacetylase (PgdA/CDA1 family)
VGTEVAITVDDIPEHGDLLPGVSREDTARGVIKVLTDHGMTHVFGFANGDFMIENPQELGILKMWLRAGYPLGNHTFSHPDLNDRSAKTFIANIGRQNRLLATLTSDSSLVKERYMFRYPFMNEGNTLGKRNAVRAYLASAGYRVAEVTVDYNDWSWTDAYARCLIQNDGKSIAWLKGHIVDAAVLHLRESNSISKRLFGRRIRQILLIHDGWFDALTLDGIIKRWRALGVRFIPLEAALVDPVYEVNPNLAYDNRLTFLKQIARSRHVDIGDLEDQAYTIDRLSEVCGATSFESSLQQQKTVP